MSTPADNVPRDADGQFVAKGVDPVTTVKTTIETNGPVEFIAKGPGADDKPLVSLTVQNPFKKIIHWLDDIRKHQTTSFDLKVKIPLIALPVFLTVLGAAFQLFFSLGKHAEKQAVAAMPTPTPIVIVQPTAIPAPVMVSKLGTIKATYQVQSLLTPTPQIVESVIASESGKDMTTPQPTAGQPLAETATPSRYVLVDKDDHIFFLVIPQTLSLNYYLNRRVLITGLFDTQQSTLTIQKTQNIEILP